MNDFESPTVNEITVFALGKLRVLLNQCTKDQQFFFNRMYGSIEAVPEGKINRVIRQCERTIKMNRKKGI